MQRLRTGIPGFDEVTQGGLLADRIYLVDGDPGAGKTTFALQFLLEGVRNGERCLYVTLSETRDELASEVANAKDKASEAAGHLENRAETARDEASEQWHEIRGKRRGDGPAMQGG